MLRQGGGCLLESRAAVLRAVFSPGNYYCLQLRGCLRLVRTIHPKAERERCAGIRLRLGDKELILMRVIGVLIERVGGLLYDSSWSGDLHTFEYSMYNEILCFVSHDL